MVKARKADEGLLGSLSCSCSPDPLPTKDVQAGPAVPPAVDFHSEMMWQDEPDDSEALGVGEFATVLGGPREQIGGSHPSRAVLAATAAMRKTAASGRQYARTCVELPKFHFFEIDSTDPVGGTPFRQGELHRFRDGSPKVLPCTVLVFTSGLYLIERETGRILSFAWTPFAVILPVVKKGSAIDTCYSCFSVALPSLERPLVLGVATSLGEKEREDWVHAMSQALAAQNASMFPLHALTVQPLDHRCSTSKRILAGYLLMKDSPTGISAPYCELQVHRQGHAKFILYESEDCRCAIICMALTATSRLAQRFGAGSAIFTLDGRTFCARSDKERDIWLRAIGNLLVKLQCEAPEPSSKEIKMFRQAILERVVQMELVEATQRLNVGGEGLWHQDSEEEIPGCDVISSPLSSRSLVRTPNAAREKAEAKPVLGAESGSTNSTRSTGSKPDCFTSEAAPHPNVSGAYPEKKARSLSRPDQASLERAFALTDRMPLADLGDLFA